jgi:hypothetical protein
VTTLWSWLTTLWSWLTTLWSWLTTLWSFYQDKGWLLWWISNIKYILICLTLFLVTTWFHVCYFIVLMSSLLLYNVENINIKKNPWMSRCVQTFDWYCM